MAATGKHALGICDICGFTYKLSELRPVFRNRRLTSILACPEDWDDDHPQLYLGDLKFGDEISLKDPRPDRNLTEQRAFFGFNPLISVFSEGQVGQITVITS